MIVPTYAPPRKAMSDYATMQGRMIWARDQVLGMSRDRLAAKLATLPEPIAVQGYSIARYEEGRRAVPVEYLAALSELSGVSLDFLIAGRTPVGTAPDAIRRVRHALDQIEEHYLTDPLDIPPEAYERLDSDDQSGGST